MNEREIRATFDDTTIRVYQAYSPHIALPALDAGTFVSPFKMSRMTWIKPSFCWMMYRCGYGMKPGQEMVLGIDITREGFDWALRRAALSTFTPSVHGNHEEWKKSLASAPVRVQWDPERNANLEKIDGVRSIQMGLSADAVALYVHEWITNIEDITPLAHSLHDPGSRSKRIFDLPTAAERRYPIGPIPSIRLGELEG